jgi:hypothetical protein
MEFSEMIFRRSSNIDLMKILIVGGELFRMDGQT